MSAVMQPSGNEVSREAYDDVRRSGRANQQHKLVLEALRQHGPSTRHDLVERTGLGLQTVCPRCHELLDRGEIEVVGTAGRPARQVLALTEEDSPE
ncbi:hypothetical protein [Halomonas organivorans]|uniref:Putative HTH transcriptional regulator n=1 Tax=Halomonas organivorans TaxID=257772 RepID=A0A7W5C1S9_9GAMM|nr:hypothetical protein [Halomonas organivorans]MBB3142213.1 putative HTH transcriptional regulator [Halomonas organivorans]